MADLPLRAKSDKPHRALAAHRCVHCHEALECVRRHTSPARLGVPVTTEFYACGACDSGFTFNPATGKWKPWIRGEY